MSRSLHNKANLNTPATSGMPLPGEELFQSARWEQALLAWRELLGGSAVVDDRISCESIGQAAVPSATPPGAVIRPACVDDVRGCVEIASRFGIPLYPVSRGKNWGYGSACPVSAGQVLLDLSRMDKILEINEELGYAVIEPGVSQGQLAKALQDRGSSFMLDVTGAGPEASIVGNTIERGFGHTPYGDHFAHSCGMQVVLPSGETLETGFGSFEGAQATSEFPWGLGPYIDGLFTQSNLGIVTRVTVWLMKRPEKIQAFAIRLADPNQLGELIDSLRELRMREVVRSSVHVANDLRVISALMGCPGQDTDHREPLDEELRRRLRRSTSTGTWNVVGGLYGSRSEVALARKEIRKHLGRFDKPLFFDEARIRTWSTLASWLGKYEFAKPHVAKLASARSCLDLLSGVPTPEHLRGAFWRNAGQHSCSDNPATAGLIWLSPVIPMTGGHAEKLLAIVEPVLKENRFDPLMTLTAINQRAMCAVLSINYDRQSEAEANRALGCYKSLWEKLLDAGYPPYRAGVQSMEAISSRQATQSFLKSLKRAIDPGEIIAPGRYIGRLD